MAYGFDADRLLVWLSRREPDGDPLTAGALCTRHADAMVVPQGWTLDDRRVHVPKLFTTAVPEDLARPVAAEPAIASVAGPASIDDPDATATIAWVPDFDVDDDLGGVLAVESPLLARAFRGTDRPR